jgi:hypothetical protein
MLRKLIDREAAVLGEALHAVREWLHPTVVMKGAAFDRPADDLGQPIDDIELHVELQRQGRGARA